MSGRDGDIRGGGGAVIGKAGWKVLVEENKVAALDGLGQRVTARIVCCREPALTMSVEIAQNDCVANHIV